MTTIELTAGERDAEALDGDNVERARSAIRDEGFVILADVVEHDHLDQLHERMTQDLEEILAQSEVPHQFVFGNVQHDPPPFAPYVHRDVLENPFVNQVTRDVLGEGVTNRFYSGNTNIPGSHLQPVHVDGGDREPKPTKPRPAHQLIANIALTDVTELNGSIELWPGSHLVMSNMAGEDIKVDPETVRARRQTDPPVRGNTRKGSILIRDDRVWHRGMPNRSSDPRFMIALIHAAASMPPGKPVRFDRQLKEFFDGIDAITDTQFCDEPIPYLSGHSSYDYPTTGYIEPE